MVLKCIATILTLFNQYAFYSAQKIFVGVQALLTDSSNYKESKFHLKSGIYF